jgi:hypothetical protein
MHFVDSNASAPTLTVPNVGNVNNIDKQIDKTITVY